MIKAEVNKFFAQKEKAPQRMKLGGKRLSVSNLPKEDQEKIKKRLSEKDEVLKQGDLGILPGIKIDGKQVTRDNIHEFEINPERPKRPGEKDVFHVPKEKLEEIVTEEEKEEVAQNKWTKDQLKAMTFSELREIGDKLNIKFRSKKEAVKEILAEQ